MGAKDRRQGAKPADEASTVIALSIDGSKYTLRVGELSALDTHDVRRETGRSLAATLAAASEDPDIDVIATIVWLARRQAGELTLKFTKVAAALGYDSSIDLVEPDKPEDHLPEA